MTLVIDTTALSKYLSADAATVDIISNPAYSRLIVPLATDAELRFGFKNGSREADNLNKYDFVCREYNLEVVPPDNETALIYAELATWCAKNGIALSNNDLWVGSAAVQCGARLLTFDNDFKHMPQMRLARL